MKLLFVIHQYFPECHSGTEQYCLAVSREARRRGDDVEVLSLDPWVWRDDPPMWFRNEPYDDFPVHRLRHWEAMAGNDVLLDYDLPLVAERFRQVLRQVRPDAIHFFHTRRLGAALITVAKEEGVRVVVNLMDFWFICPRFTLLRTDGELCEGPPDNGLGCLHCEFPDLAETFGSADVAAPTQAFAAALGGPMRQDSAAARAAAVLNRRNTVLAHLERADAVIAPSRFLADMFRKNGFDSPRMQVVGYGLEPGRVQRREVQRPRSPLRLGFAGVMSPWKGPDVLVDAAREVEGAFDLALYGRTEEAMFQDFIDPMLERAQGDARIRFPGPFDASQLDDVMADLDLLIVPSLWYENTPFVVLEAFEAGVPVAVSDLGGMTEVVTPGVNGFHFGAGDVDSLRALLQSLVDDPSQLASLTPTPVASIAGNYEAFRPLYGD